VIDLHFELDEEPTPSLVAKIGRHQLLYEKKNRAQYQEVKHQDHLLARTQVVDVTRIK